MATVSSRERIEGRLKDVLAHIAAHQGVVTSWMAGFAPCDSRRGGEMRVDLTINIIIPAELAQKLRPMKKLPQAQKVLDI